MNWLNRDQDKAEEVEAKTKTAKKSNNK